MLVQIQFHHDNDDDGRELVAQRDFNCDDFDAVAFVSELDAWFGGVQRRHPRDTDYGTWAIVPETDQFFQVAFERDTE